MVKGEGQMTKVHMFCGSHKQPEQFDGWDCIDINPPPGGIRRNLVENGLPYDDNTVDYIFSEHGLEHITRPQALNLLVECRRVLKPRAVIRTTVPSIEALLDAYVKRDLTRWGDVPWAKTPAQMLWNGLTSWGHRFAYDANELILIHKEAGFSTAGIANHGKYEVRAWSGEITVEAVK